MHPDSDQRQHGCSAGRGRRGVFLAHSLANQLGDATPGLLRTQAKCFPKVFIDVKLSTSHDV
jgi:hypothetical protein